MEGAEITRPCPFCAETILAEARKCKHCGEMLEPMTTSAPPRQSKWYYNVWFVLFMLFFVLGPFGLPLAWKNPRFARWVKIVLSLAMVLYTVILIQLTVNMARAVMKDVNQFNATLGW